jgi:hypothetical protein
MGKIGKEGRGIKNLSSSPPIVSPSFTVIFKMDYEQAHRESIYMIFGIEGGHRQIS